jgi:hypothetical protein
MKTETADSAGGAARAILDADAARRRAMVGGDIAALERLIADGLIYTHSTGHIDDRDSYLAPQRSRELTYRSIEISEARVTVNGDTGWIVAQARTHLTRAGKENFNHVQFLAVWVLDGGAWKMAAYNAMRIQAT